VPTQQNASNSIGKQLQQGTSFISGMPAVAMSRAASPLESVGKSIRKEGEGICFAEYSQHTTLMAVHYSCPRHALLVLHIGTLKRIQKKYAGHVLFIFSLLKVAGHYTRYLVHGQK
jgi:hypothetical protein